MVKVSPKELADVEKKIGWLADRTNEVDPLTAESLFVEIAAPLLELMGYEVHIPHPGPFSLIVYMSQSFGTFLYALQYKHHKKPLPPSVVRELLGACTLEHVTKGILVSRSGFSKASLASVQGHSRFQVELIDLLSLRKWVDVIRNPPGEARSRFIEAVREFSLSLARDIAKDPLFLYEVEWRDLERIMAEVFDALGFLVTLTPSSRDGGKDVIIEGVVTGKRESYVIEIKHWRSGKHVGHEEVLDFISVVMREKRQGGLLLATSGYTSNVVEVITEISKQRVRLGTAEKILALCCRYARSASGIWEVPQSLPDLLFEDTLERIGDT